MRLFVIAPLAFIVVCSCVAVENPTMAILTEPMAWGSCTCLRGLQRSSNVSGCVYSVYVKWLQASGIRVVAIPWDAPRTELDYVMSSTNGLLLMGGVLADKTFEMTEYYEVAKYVYRKTMEMNAQGDPFVLWGTCQGFQMIWRAAADNFTAMSNGFVGMHPLMMRVNMTTFANGSRMLGNTPDEILSALTQRNVTLNWHQRGATPQSYAENPGLRRSLLPLASTNDIEGKTFYAAIEGVTAAVYGTQFHPERPPYEFSKEEIGHDVSTIRVSRYFSNFIRQQLQRNNHTFGSREEVEKYSIENRATLHKNLGVGDQAYFL